MLSVAKNEKKLNLEELIVQSFVTTLDEEMQRKLQGGQEVASDIDQCGGGGGGGEICNKRPGLVTGDIP